MASAAAPLEVAETLASRINATRVAHRDAQEVAAKCAKAFRAAVVDAIEAGMRQADVAELAGVTRSRLHKIMVTEYSAP